MDIRNIRLPDGTPCASVMDAVDKFKCPGPCGPDCPLYRSVRIECQRFGHMCHDEIVGRHPKAVLDAMGCTYEVCRAASEAAGADRQVYAAVIVASAVRDMQYCKDANHDPMDDCSWEDLPNAEIWLGFFRGPNALAKAARFGMTDPANIRLMPVTEDMEAM